MQRKRQLLQLIIFAVDVVMMTIAYALAYAVRFYYLPDGIVGGDYFMLYMVVLVLYALVFYIGSEKWRGLSPSWTEDLAALLQNHIYMGLFLFAFLFVMKSGTEYSRLQIFLFLILSFIFSYVIRRCVRRELVRRLKSSNAVEKIVLVSAKDSVGALLAQMERKETWYYKVTGICLLDADWKGKDIQGIKILANREDMLAVLAKESLDSVLIGGDISGANIEALVEGLCSMGITTHVQIQSAKAFDGERQYDEFGDMAVMSYMTLNRDLRSRLLYRVADILVGMLGSILCIVCYFFVAAIIGVTSGGPVTITYTRVGRNGRRFHVHLFRTKDMSSTKRKMRLGRFLEWSGLQCMPLFFHLLTGDLTLIGEAAPSLPEFMSYTPGQRQRMCKKPGLIATWMRGQCFDEDEQDGQLALWIEERKNLFAAWENQPDFGHIPIRLRVYHGMKRILDVALSGAFIIILSPLWLLIVVVIYFSDGHSPLYTQVRVGKHGRKISIYKFRSMQYQSDDLERLLTAEQLLQYKKEFKVTDDPRVTPIGKFLRRSSLDELPQLLNIFKGDISFIGPRPIVAKETEVYGEDIVKLLCVKPGLTGYWQAYARNHATYATGERQKMELYYVDHEHVLLDMKIIVRTVGRVITGDGAL